jgi:hypothetical protein
MNSNTIRRGLRDLEKSPRDKRRVFNLILKIHSKINSIKRSKKTAYKELKI